MALQAAAAGTATRNEGSGYAWYVCFVLVLAYVFSFIDRGIVTLIVQPIQRDLGVDDTQVSLLHGLSFAIFYAGLGLPIARLVDSRNRRNLIILGITVWSLMTAACGLADGFWTLFIARVGVGAGEAVLVPAAASLLADYFSGAKLGRALGVFAMGIYLGSGLALILGGWVIHLVGPGGAVLPLFGQRHDWQVVFVVVGLPGLLIAALMLSVREPPRRGVAAGASPKGVPFGEVIAYFKANRTTLACHLFGFTLLAMMGYAAGAWIPTLFIRIHGWSVGEIAGLFGTTAMIVGPIGTVTGGWLADRLRRRGIREGTLVVGLLAALLALPFAALFPIMPNATAALVLMTVFFLFTSFMGGVAPAALQELMPNQMRGQATALYTALTSLIGLGLGPTLVALLTDQVFQDKAAVGSALAIVGPIAAALAALIFWRGFKPYRASLDRAQQWTREHGGTAG